MDQYSNHSGLKFVHVNCRSLYNKLDDLICVYQNYDFIACTETWLNTSHTESMLSFPGKSLFRLDRQTKLANGATKKGGGICVYIDNKYSKFCKAISSCSVSNADLEILTIGLMKPGLKFMNISVVYKPPQNPG